MKNREQYIIWQIKWPSSILCLDKVDREKGNWKGSTGGEGEEQSVNPSEGPKPALLFSLGPVAFKNSLTSL